MKKYIVELTTEQRKELSHMVSTGKAAARELTHARILLKADQGPEGPAWSDSQIQEALEVSASTVQRVIPMCVLTDTIVPRSHASLAIQKCPLECTLV